MSNLSLYNLTAEMAELRDILMENGGELTPELDERYTMNEVALRTKADNYNALINSFVDYSENIDKEIKRLQALKKVSDNAGKRLKERIKGAMIDNDIDVIEGGLCKFMLRKSPVATEVDEETLLAPYEAKMEVARRSLPEWLGIEFKVDKKALKDLYYGKDYAPAGVTFTDTNKALTIK